MSIELAQPREPGLQVAAIPPPAPRPTRRRRLQLAWARFSDQPLGMLGLALILLFAAMALIHPLLRATVWSHIRYDPVTGYDTAVPFHPSPPSPIHPLGTDGLGRDVLSQLFYGARVSFAVGLLAALVAVGVSTTLGAAAGYFHGWVDLLLMALADVFVLLPAPVALLIFGLLVRMDWPGIAVAYGLLTGLGTQAVVVKAQTLTIKARPFVQAARVAGGSDLHILRRHILPGLVPLILVHAVFTVVGAVLVESLLSFFGRTRIDLSWGTMIWLGQRTFRWFTLEGQWHAIAPPALAIMFFCSAFYLIGRALDDVANPRLRRR